MGISTEENIIIKQSELAEAGRILSDKKLVWGKSGNISVKIDTDTFLISAGGMDLSSLKQDDIIICGIGGDSWSGKKRPSMETSMHRNIYQTCPEAAAVIHAQAVYSTIVACSNLEIRMDVLPESMAYLGDVKRVPYYHAGSMELADAVASSAKSSPVLLLENHGTVCFGKSLEEAVLKAETLEFLCKLIVKSHNQIKLNRLGDHVMKDFLDHLRKICG